MKIEKEIISIQIEKEIEKELSRIAKEDHRSRNNIINIAIKEFINNHDKREVVA